MLLKRQELVEFDPANIEHRAAVRAFLKRKAWVDSPFRFAQDPTYGTLVEQVQAKLLKWYLDQEEAKVNKPNKGKSKSVLPPGNPIRLVA